MKIDGIIWFRDVVDKLDFKHHVETDEVEDVFDGKPKFRFVEKGHNDEAKTCILLWVKPARADTWQYCSATS